MGNGKPQGKAFLNQSITQLKNFQGIGFKVDESIDKLRVIIFTTHAMYLPVVRLEEQILGKWCIWKRLVLIGRQNGKERQITHS